MENYLLGEKKLIKNKVNCSNVYVNTSTFATKHNNFDGAFATNDLKKNDIVEWGNVRLLPEGFDGNNSPYVFTWSDELPNKTWAMASGCAAFYNTSIKEANVKMNRDFVNNTFVIVALRDIKAGEELLHTYKSLQWRTCFQDIKEILN